MNWWFILWAGLPGLILAFHSQISVSWDDVNVYFGRRSSKYERMLARTKELEIECEIRDAAGDLVHKPKWPTKGWDAEERPAVDPIGRPLFPVEPKRKYQYEGSIEQQIYEKHQDTLMDLHQRKIEVLNATVGPARVILPEEYARNREALLGYLRSAPPIPTMKTYSTGPR